MFNTQKHTTASTTPKPLDKESLDIIYDSKLEGTILKDKYMVGRLIDRGSFGKVYKVTDTANSDRPLVIKVSNQNELIAKEIKTMKNIWRKGKALRISGSDLGMTPEVVACGMVIDLESNKLGLSTEQIMSNRENFNISSYVIMPRFGMNLEDLFQRRKNQFTKQQIWSLGIQLLNMLERIHEAGYVYNDLKLDNLLLNIKADKNYLKTTDDNIFEDHQVNIIDFGFATRYKDKKTKEHLEKEEVDVFRGNMVFASLN